MKKHIFVFTIIVLIASYSLTAQVAVSTDGSSPDASAMLDVQSTDKGILFPRMSQGEIASIVNPAGSLIVFNTTDNHFYYYDDVIGEWKEVAIGAGTITPLPTFTCGTSTISDNDGNLYNTVLIDDQCWMKENLKTTKYNDGSDIPLVTDNSAWDALTTPAYCYYLNDEATYGATYGALYNWYTVNTSNLCPTGWHVPTDGEWTLLSDYLGGTTIAGGKMKESGIVHWNSPNTDATNSSNFSGLPGGARGYDGPFIDIGDFGHWWSSTGYLSFNAWSRNMAYNYGELVVSYNYHENAISVRCIRD